MNNDAEEDEPGGQEAQDEAVRRALRAGTHRDTHETEETIESEGGGVP